MEGNVQCKPCHILLNFKKQRFYVKVGRFYGYILKLRRIIYVNVKSFLIIAIVAFLVFSLDWLNTVLWPSNVYTNSSGSSNISKVGSHIYCSPKVNKINFCQLIISSVVILLPLNILLKDWFCDIFIKL